MGLTCFVLKFVWNFYWPHVWVLQNRTLISLLQKEGVAPIKLARQTHLIQSYFQESDKLQIFGCLISLLAQPSALPSDVGSWSRRILPAKPGAYLINYQLIIWTQLHWFDQHIEPQQLLHHNHNPLLQRTNTTIGRPGPVLFCYFWIGSVIWLQVCLCSYAMVDR